MFPQFDPTLFQFEDVKAHHQEMVNQILQAQMDDVLLTGERQERQRFLRLYRMRRIFFRLAPELAARLLL